MKTKLFKTLIGVSIIASMFFAVEASAIGTLADPDGSNPWGASLKEYSDRTLAYVTNWGGHTVKAARGRDGDCLRLKKSDGDNWVYLGKTSYPGNILTAGTTYTLSVDYLPGPFGYNWPSVGLQFSVGGQTIIFSQMDNPNAKEWKTFSQDFTATGQGSPQVKLTTSNADIYLDNLVIKEKSTGNVVYNHNFDMLNTSHPNDWGYNPGRYAETNAVPFYGIPGNDSIGVIERDGGYAAYIRNATGSDVHWRFSNMEAKVKALPDGQYKVKFDYVYCDTATTSQNYLAERMTWSEAWTTASYSWITYENTFTKTSSTQCGFKIKPGCRMCIDNFRVEDLEGNVLVIENFDTVPLWAGPDQFIVEPAVISQSSNTMNVSAKVTNSFTGTKDLYLITAIFSSDGRFESADKTRVEVAGDPRGINHTTTISSTQNVSGDQGKTFKVFLWDNLDDINALADFTKKTIE